MKSYKQKRELLKQLEVRNMGPIELLEKLSEVCTPYAHLIKLAAEEFGFSTGPSRSQKVEDLERESAVNSAKKEVEIQQTIQKLAKIKGEGQELKSKLTRYQKRLSALNKDIERLTHLSNVNGLTSREPGPVVQRNVELDDEGLEPVKAIPLDEAKYKLLWTEHTQLLKQLGELKEELLQRQVQQMVVFRDRARDLVYGGIFRHRK
jgi:predicted RNase H-like nuclease (RuvC/YqgF family)